MCGSMERYKVSIALHIMDFIEMHIINKRGGACVYVIKGSHIAFIYRAYRSFYVVSVMHIKFGRLAVAERFSHAIGRAA